MEFWGVLLVRGGGVCVRISGISVSVLAGTDPPVVREDHSDFE